MSFYLFFSRSACQWNKRLCKLSLHYEHGFALYSESEYPTGPSRLIWQEPFEKLYVSSDDNDHLLRLDFHGEEGVVVKTCQNTHLSLFPTFSFDYLGIRFWNFPETIYISSSRVSFSQSSAYRFNSLVTVEIIFSGRLFFDHLSFQNCSYLSSLVTMHSLFSLFFFTILFIRCLQIDCELKNTIKSTRQMTLENLLMINDWR